MSGAGASNSWKSRLVGTLQSYFQIGGTTGPRWKANAGNLDSRDSTDSHFVNVRGADPLGNNDFVNLESANKNYLGLTIDVPSPGSYTITGTIGIASQGTGAPLFAAKPNASAVQCDTALQSGGSFPSTGWWVELVYFGIPMDYGGNYPLMGPCVATGTTGADTAYNIVRYWQNSSNGVLPSLQAQTFHPGGQSTSTAANGVNDFAVDKQAGAQRLSLLSDGTNLYTRLSWDGYWWLPWVSQSLPGSIAYWGFCLGNGNNSGTTGRLAASIYRNKLHSTLTVPQTAITNVANNGSGAFRVTSAGHGANTGDIVSIHGVTGSTGINTSTGTLLANLWVVTVIDANTVDLVASTFAGVYASGGTLTVISR